MSAALDKCLGCLLGGAAGDALGYAVEFSSEREIFACFGPEGISGYRLSGGLARISDDTQMTLFTANGLLWAQTQRALGREAGFCDGVSAAYRDWYLTQTRRYPLPDRHWAASHSCWLLEVPELYSRRAPGNTCLSALAGFVPGSMRSPINDSKGCGGVMRIAPAGLFFDDAGEAALTAAECAALTHGHELGCIPAAYVAHMVCTLSHGQAAGPREAALGALRDMERLFPAAAHLDGFVQLIGHALDLAESSLAPLEAIHRLGAGWVGDEAAAIALYCALKYPDDLGRALTAAVNHSGDSDSTGAIAGGILGAHLGLGGIPARFLERLELRGVIEELAEDLHRGCPAQDAPEPERRRWQRKYLEIRRCV